MSGTKSLLSLTPDTRITLSLVGTILAGAYWLFSMSAQVNAQESRLEKVESAQVELADKLISRLDEQTDKMNDISVNVAGIEASVGLLVKWSEFKRDDRPNSRP